MKPVNFCKYFNNFDYQNLNIYSISIDLIELELTLMKGVDSFPEISSKLIKKFEIIRLLGSGSFGKIYQAKHRRTGKLVAIKHESPEISPPQLENEMRIYKKLTGFPGFADIYLSLNEISGHYCVMELLGQNLQQLYEICGFIFTLKSVYMIFDQMIRRIENLHSKCFLHRDLKPENFVIGRNEHKNTIYLIDFGLSSMYCDPLTSIHIPMREGRDMVGTIRYASVNYHKGIEGSRRDDLESLFYIILYFLRGQLPWQGLKHRTRVKKSVRIAQIKEKLTIEELCRGLPPVFEEYIKYVRSLDFDETPDYQFCYSIIKRGMDNEGYTFDGCFDWNSIEDIDKIFKEQKNPYLEEEETRQNIPSNNQYYKLFIKTNQNEKIDFDHHNKPEKHNPIQLSAKTLLKTLS